MSKHDILRKFAAVRSTDRGIVPDQAWVLRTRERLVKDAKQSLASGAMQQPSRMKALRAFVPARAFDFLRAPALAMMSILVTVLGGSLVGVSASERSVPGDFLYPIKLAGEQTRMAFISDKTERIKLKTEYVDRRVAEIKTIASQPNPESSARLKEAAKGLKRDLDTVKNQLRDVKQEKGPKAAEVAKLVDQKSGEVVQELKQVKDVVAQEVKSTMAEAETAALQTGVTAVEVMIDVKADPESKEIITDEEVANAIESKVVDIQASLSGTAERLRAVSPSGTIPDQSASSSMTSSTSVSLDFLTASSSAFQINAASATLQEVRVLLDENKLEEVTDKLHEAATAAAQAEATFALASSSTTPTPVVPTPSTPTATSTTPPK